MSLSLVGAAKPPVYNINSVWRWHYLYLSKFHTSICNFSDKDKELENRIKNLSIDDKDIDDKDIDKDINLSKEEYDDMKKSLLEFKNNLSNVDEIDVNDEFNSVKNYLTTTKNDISSFEEAFPNYSKEKNIVIEDKNVFSIAKKLKKFLDECESGDTQTQDNCLKLKLTNIIEKVS